LAISIREDREQLDKVYRLLNNRAEKLYDFVCRYSAYMSEPKDYGNGHLISMSEVHVLTHIEENPGITITQLALEREKTKSAISQTVKRLEKDGYIYRRKKEGDGKVVLLFPTEKGINLSVSHKLYDLSDIANTSEALLRTCSEEEIDNFYKVIDAYRALFDEDEE